MEFITIFILAITVEALVEYIKLIIQSKFNWKHITAVVLSVLFAVLTQVDLFALVGVTFIIPHIGTALTGIIFSRGANYLSDFIKRIQQPQEVVHGTDQTGNGKE